jgi:hypothetical protein
MKRFHAPQWTFPLALLLICGVGYGLLIGWLGFYQDDWYQIWFGRAFGSQIFVDYYSYERPFIAGLYLLTTPFIGSNPTSWQIFALFTRFMAALSLWWTLGLAWQKQRISIACITILFALYPGFRQQWASVIYSHYFLQFAIQMASIGLMLLAVRRPRQYWLFTILAVAGAIIGLFSSEYFFGLEFLRPIFLWWVIQEDKAEPVRYRWRRFLINWLPYLLILVGFLIWRIFIFQFPTYQPIYANTPAGGLLALGLKLVKTVVSDVIETGLVAWSYPLATFWQTSLRQPAALIAFTLSIVGTILIGLYLWFLQPLEAEEPITGRQDRKFALGLIGSGLFALFASGWPFWFVDLQVNLELGEGSRLTLSFMLGASLLIVGLIELIFRRNLWRIVSVSILAGLAIGHHFLDSNTYRQVHRFQAEFFQQLTWRAPGIEPHTIVLTDAFNDVIFSGDNSLTAALNWVYQPNPPYSLDYLFAHSLPDLTPDQPVEKDFRTAKFTGSTSDVLVVYAKPGKCLRILAAEDDSESLQPAGMTGEVKKAISLSNLSRIISNPVDSARLSNEVFKYIPSENSWCYFYEKADFARQQKNWPEVVRLAAQAFPEQRKVESTWEFIPFIDGYAYTGDIEQARQLSDRIRQSAPEGKKATLDLLCNTWTKIGLASEADDALKVNVANILSEYGCP